ncbi:MAG: glutaminyl-peptide cyclotransferase [Pseudomonadota bacterium]
MILRFSVRHRGGQPFSPGTARGRLAAMAVVLLLSLSGWFPASVLATPTEYGYQVVERFPHRSTAFTQGLLIHDGVLYEGTGRYGRSGVARLDLEEGRLLDHRSLPRQYFGEGIAIFDNRLYQLTWKSGLVFVYDADTLEPETSHYHPGEGWGLTHDGESLILSDGSDMLQFIRPDDFSVIRRIPVTLDGQPVHRLNELEYIDGEVWANVWMSDYIVRIDPDSGEVVGLVDLSGLSEQTSTEGSDSVLNGIAWDPDEERLFVTGKLWGHLFEIELLGRERSGDVPRP